MEDAVLLRQELMAKYLPSLKKGDVEVCEDLEVLMATHGLNKECKSCCFSKQKLSQKKFEGLSQK